MLIDVAFFFYFLSGVARGTGWQDLGAYVNLGAYYLVGIPVALVLGFVLHLRGKGLWMGLTTGAVVQSALLSIITYFTDWKRKVLMANSLFLLQNAVCKMFLLNLYAKSMKGEFVLMLNR